MNDKPEDPRLYAIPDIHGHAKGEHKAFIDERPIPLSARMLFLWFFHACRRGWPRFMMVTDHMNYLTFEDPAAINLVRRALKLAQAGDLYGAAETASVEVGHAAVVSEGLRRGMRYSIGAEVDNDPRSRPDAQNIVDAMKPDGMIRSVHFLTIDHPTHGPNWNWPFDNPEFADVYETVGTEKTWELYMTTLLDAVERLPGNIVGHFYVPALFGHWPDDATLETYEDRLVEACAARGMAIEFNTRFLYRNHSEAQRAKYLAANRRLLRKCKEKNVGIAIGSDAHSPRDQAAGFETVLAVLDQCEINELVFPIAGRLARVALRIERKTDAAPEPPPAPAQERKAARKARPAESVVVRGEKSAAVVGDAVESAASPKNKPRPKRTRIKAESQSAVSDSAVDIVTTDEAVIAATVADEISAPVLEPIVTVASDDHAASPSPEQAADEVADAPAPATVDDRPPVEPVPEESDVPAPSEREPSVGEPSVGEPAVGEPAAVRDSLNGERTRTSSRKQPKPAPVKAKPAAGTAKPTPSATKKAAKPAARATVKKAPPKKTGPKKAAAKKAVAKHAPAKKTSAKKTGAKKAAVRGTAAKKSTAKKSVAKKGAPKKPAQRRR